MKKLLLSSLMLPLAISAQVGINNPAPTSTLDVTAKNPTGTETNVDGIIIPRVDRLRAQNMTGTPTSTMIYVNSIANGTQNGTAANIDTIGFYYFNGTAWIKVDSTIYDRNGSLSSARNVNLAGNNLGFTGTGNVGIGIAAPTAKLEVSSGTTGTSGMKFTNINNTTPTTQNAAALGVDANGNVVIQNVAPLTTTFKSFSIDANVATNSVITLGSLQFRYPTTTCADTNTYLEVRSTTGANNTGILHAISRSSQASTGLINTTPMTFTPTFANLGAGIPGTANPALVPVNCVQDGAAQFTFFSYTDRTYYRVSFHIADGDSLGFGALGYIFAELQR